MLRGRKYLPSSHSTNIHLLPSCCRRFPQRTRHHPINGWIDTLTYLQGNCTRRSRSKDQERASLLSGRLSRAYIDITTSSPPPPPPTSAIPHDWHIGSHRVRVLYVHAHARTQADASTCATTYAWEYHYLSCVFSVNCHYRWNLVMGCVPPWRCCRCYCWWKTLKNGPCTNRPVSLTIPTSVALNMHARTDLEYLLLQWL